MKEVLMVCLKKLAMFAFFVAISGVVFSASSSSKKEDVLSRIVALQDTVADKNCVRSYIPADYDQTYRVLQESMLGWFLKYEKSGGVALVYEKDARILGACVFEPTNGYIHALAVSRDVKRQKIGSALIYATMYNVCKNHDGKNLFVCSYESSIPFYKKLGFTFDNRDGILNIV